MAEFGVFMADDTSAQLWTITADSPEEAEAQMLEKHPGALVKVVPGAALEGCNRQRLLWGWLWTLRGEQA